MERARVLIVDDHPVVRKGLKAILQDESAIEVVGEAGDGLEAVAKVAELLPDVVLMDLRMGGNDGVAATWEIKSVSPRTKVIILSSYENDDEVFEAIKAGASGYVLKDATPEQLLHSIVSADHDFSFMSASVAAKMLGVFRRQCGPETAVMDRPGDDLTEREREVLSLVAGGHTNIEIARELCITERTVKTHITNIFSKLHISQRTQAVLYAVRHGLVR
ncbi:MAG: response regulator transcription factor [Chloroflexota bacterium]|nr:MAG: response regulator transcription factor [Chloroflexota bacterium]